MALFDYAQEVGIINEGLFNRKPKVQKIKIEPSIEPEDALKKIIPIAKKHLNKVERFSSVLKWNVKLDGEEHYKDFINKKETYIDVAEYDTRKLNLKIPKDEYDFDVYLDYWENVKQAVKDINNEINEKYGYTFAVSDDSEVMGRGGFTIESGATIQK